MIRTAWLKAVRSWMTASPRRRARGSHAANPWAADIRTLEARTLLSSTESPGVALDAGSIALDENSDTSMPTFLANITVTSTPPGTITLSLGGSDPGSFEIVNDKLFLKAGVDLNFEAQDQYTVNVDVDDSEFPGVRDAFAGFTLNVNDVNEAPEVGNQTFTVFVGAPNGTVVGTVAATDPENDILTYTAFVESHPGVFAIDPGTGVITVANSAALTNGLMATLSVEVADDDIPPLFGLANMTINVVTNTAPTIGGAAANQAVNDNATISPFSTVTVTDPDTQALTATVTITNGANRGDFTPGSATGWTRSTSGSDILYTQTFPAAANIGSVAQTAIRALVFDPRENAIAPGTTETTAFTLQVNDGVAAAVTNSTTSVITTSVNNTPSIGGAAANQAVNDNATINPFSGATVTDPDTQLITATVTITNGANRGDFTPGSATGWTRSTSGSDITYTRTFSAAANNGAVVQAAIRALVFDPRENAITPGTTETTAFTLTVTDGTTPVTNSTTTVITTSVNDALSISGAVANQAVNDSASISPFSGVIVTDPDTQALTANVAIKNGVNRGDFVLATTTGWTRTTPSNGDIVYARTFPAAANNGAVVQAAIRGLLFHPRENAIKPGTTETTPFTITIFGGSPTPVVNSTASVVTTSINDVPAFSGIMNSSVNDDAFVNPFNGLEINDSDFQEGLAKVTILNGVVRGDFLNAVPDWTRTVLGNNIQYARYFNPSADVGNTVMNALRGLTFKPRQNVIPPGTTELTDFQVTFSDGVAAPIVNSATRVTTMSANHAPTITGAVPNLPVFDNATATPFVAEVTSLAITDPDKQDMFATVTINNGVVRGDFTPASRAGWTRAVNGNNIVYTRYFAQAVNIGNVVQTAVRAFVFQPRVNVLTPGTTETTTFTLSVKDGSNASATNTGTSVVTTSANDAPTIGGTVAGQTMNDNATKAVFSTVTITDADSDDMLVRVTIPNGVNRGDFTAGSTGGWTKTVNGIDIKYERYFNTATNIGAVVQTAIRALTFQPRTNVQINTTETTGFTIFVNDGFANATNSTTSVITTGVAPRPALLTQSRILDSDTTTVVLPSTTKPRGNPLTRLLKPSR